MGESQNETGGHMEYDYKCVAAPEKARRRRGARTRTDRVALAMEDILKAEATGGWEYQRTDLIPVEEKSGWFGRAHEVHRAVLVFRKPKKSARPHVIETAPRSEPAPVQPVETKPQPVEAAPRIEPAPAPEPESDGDFKLAAKRDEAPEAVAVSEKPLRAPSGLS
ncbi:MAG: hypothetical protein AAF479_14755 [Pseudomonadota bacterium]